MNITVFGATGRTGRAFLTLAGAAGHHTVAQVRDPARLGRAPAGRVVPGGAFDEAAVADALTGADAAVIAFGLRGNRSTPLYSRGTALIVDEMRRQGVPRLVVVSEAGYGRHVSGRTGRAFAAVYRATARPLLRERDAQDAIVEGSGLDWTVVRPGVLHAGEPRGVRPRRSAPYLGLAPRTTFTDLAALVLEAIGDPKTHGSDLYP
ncbi:NAD(P)-dependent oxidoreductase [Streptomyces sp. NPDC020681]|uniref:NAD(P)-dependent oxidoreductase n=1 Tax=Streptomyces sp. NPDC020681 TaxID=3365083 RepID=UPI00379075D8